MPQNLTPDYGHLKTDGKRMRTGRNWRNACRIGFAWLLTGALAMSGMACAIEMEDLYTVQVATDPNDPDSQNVAYEYALREILIRMTGSERAADSEELAGIFPTPAQYVLRYRRGESDSLVVTLDGPAIEALLRRAGQPVWGTDRPLTLVWLAVDWGMGEREIVGSDDAARAAARSRSIDRNRLLRERVIATAKRRGIPVLFPLLDAEDRENVSFSDIWGGFDDALLAASRRYSTTSILVGRVRGEDLYRNRWNYYFGGQRLEWTGGPETAVNLLADALAEQFAFAGNAPVENVLLTISGVDSVSAYGSVQKLLADLSVIDDFQVDTVAGGDIRFQVRVRGGAERLKSALEFSGVLQRADWLGVQDYFGAEEPSESLDYVFSPYLPDAGIDESRSSDDLNVSPGSDFD